MYRAMEWYDKLRYRLMPYIYTIAADTYHRDGTIMRGLVMDFPSDPKVRELNDEYLFGRAFLVANLQAVAPTGTDPFKIRRSATGNPLEAATGAGFWSISPSVTAILPTDPAVLFGTIGYGRNFLGENRGP